MCCNPTGGACGLWVGIGIRARDVRLARTSPSEQYPFPASSGQVSQVVVLRSSQMMLADAAHREYTAMTLAGISVVDSPCR